MSRPQLLFQISFDASRAVAGTPGEVNNADTVFKMTFARSARVCGSVWVAIAEADAVHAGHGASHHAVLRSHPSIAATTTTASNAWLRLMRRSVAMGLFVFALLLRVVVTRVFHAVQFHRLHEALGPQLDLFGGLPQLQLGRVRGDPRGEQGLLVLLQQTVNGPHQEGVRPRRLPPLQNKTTPRPKEKKDNTATTPTDVRKRCADAVLNSVCFAALTQFQTVASAAVCEPKCGSHLKPADPN